MGRLIVKLLLPEGFLGGFAKGSLTDILGKIGLSNLLLLLLSHVPPPYTHTCMHACTRQVWTLVNIHCQELAPVGKTSSRQKPEWSLGKEMGTGQTSKCLVQAWGRPNVLK